MEPAVLAAERLEHSDFFTALTRAVNTLAVPGLVEAAYSHHAIPVTMLGVPPWFVL